MSTALVIAYHFPPQPGGGVQRSTKFVRYLPAFGWRPVVLTIDSTLHHHRDATLLDEIEAADVVRVRSSVLPDPFVRWRALRGVLDRVLVPDSHIMWVPIAERAVAELHRKYRFDVIYTSCRPFSLAPLGERLRRKYHVPWVLDLRDLWTLNPAFPSMAKLPGQRRVHEKYERAAVESCSHLIVTSDSSLRAMHEKYPELAGKSSCIPNGFDRSDFASGPPVGGNNAWRFVYAGACYPPYSPDRILTIVRQWHGHADVPCEIHYAGLHERAFLAAAERAGAKKLVRSHGNLTHHASIDLMRSADALLLFLPELPAAQGWVPGKLYEYLACHAPILACAAAGDASEIIRRAEAGVVVGPHASIDEGVAALDRLYRQGARPRNDEQVSQYERRKLTARLAAIFDHVASRAAAPELPASAVAKG